MGDEHALDRVDGQDARVMEVGVMVAKDGNLTENTLREIRSAVARYIKRQGYSQALVAQKLGSNAAYISAFLAGKFGEIPAASLQKLARALNEWMEYDNRRKLRGIERRFVHTLVAERIIKGARIAAETGDIILMHGPGGCGKTITLEELTTLIPASIYLLITPDSARKSGFLRALYEAVWQHRGPSRPTLTDVIERLKQSDRLLMLDNADLLHPDVYPILMSLHDVAKIPILIVGTFKLLQKLTHDADPLRGQMSSRIGMRIELLHEKTSPRSRGRGKVWVTAADIRTMFETGRVKLHPGAVSRLKAIGSHEVGYLRRCERYVRYSILQLPRTGPAVITPEVLENAIKLVDADEAPAVRHEVDRDVAAAAV